MAELDEQIIKTIDEDGREVNLKLLDIVMVDDQEYALLANVDETSDTESETEAVLMRLKKENDEYIFEAIDNDEEFELVAQAIMSEQEE